MTSKFAVLTTSQTDYFDLVTDDAEPSTLELYEYQGTYADRFDAVDTGDTADIEPVTDPFGGLWLCRTDDDGNYTECTPW